MSQQKELIDIYSSLKGSSEKIIETCIFQLRINKRSLVSHNFIVEAGAYTISKNSKNILQLKSTATPSQWTKAGADEIVATAVIENSNGRVIPTIYGKSDWYKKELENAWRARTMAMETLSKLNA